MGERGRSRRAGIWAAAALIALLAVSAGFAGSVVPTPISEDPYTNSGPHHRTQVEPDSFAFGQTIVATSQSGRYFSGGGSSNNVFSTSTNGGRTWVTGGLPGTTVHATPPGPWPRISDPAVAYDPEHGVWLAQGLAINSSGIGFAVIANRSTDGGLTWSSPVTVAQSGGTFWDKTWIACDVWPQSPHYGNCYSQWDDNGLGNRMLMSTSTDGGLTWSAPQAPPGMPSGLGGQPVVLPNGTAVVPYTQNFSGIAAFRSTNGGVSWTSAVTVTSQTAHGVAGNMRDPSLPSAEVDAAGRLYLVWHDCRYRTGCSANDIVMSTSLDGATWTPVVRIPIDPVDSNRDHFLPGIGADRATAGHIGLGYYYYPVSNCGSDCQLTYGFISSLDGGTTWSNPHQVTAPMNPTWLPDTTGWGRMVGDYTSTSFTADGKAYVVYSVAKRPTSGTCVTTGIACSQRLAMSRFDITAPPFEPRVWARKDTVRYFPPRRPEDEPYYPRTG